MCVLSKFTKRELLNTLRSTLYQHSISGDDVEYILNGLNDSNEQIKDKEFMISLFNIFEFLGFTRNSISNIIISFVSKLNLPASEHYELRSYSKI